jgi:SAM-dependent methyltransferase
MTPVFDGYSRYYDLLYRDKDYPAEAAWVLSRIRSHSPQAERILELGCGTAAHAVALAQQGISVHGIDRSDSMLLRARDRIERESPGIRSRVRLAPGDARTVRTGEKYDAVISLFHVVSYLNADRDLALAFETAAEHLNPGGLFLFDFWYGPAVLSQKPDVRVKRLADHECSITRIAEPDLRADENIVDVNYSLFIEQKSTALITRLQETHSMRYLFPAELNALSGPWFEPVDLRAWMSAAQADTSTWSAFQTMARK